MIAQHSSSQHYRTITISITTSYTNLRTLLNTALSALILPIGVIIQVNITPAGNINYRDAFLGSEQSLGNGVEKRFPCRNILDVLQLKAAGATDCQVELYIDNQD